MVQTIQRIIEIPQLPLVFRWSMSLLCSSCRHHGRYALGSQKYCVFLGDDGICFRIRFGSTVDTFFVSLQRPGLSCRGAEVDSHGLAVQHTMVSPQLQFIINVVIFHFVAQRLFQMV